METFYLVFGPMELTAEFGYTTTYVKAEQVVSAILDEIKSTLQQGDSVILRRFGSFDVRDKRARMGRNPKTGKEATIPARRVVRFKSGNQLKAATNGRASESVTQKVSA